MDHAAPSVRFFLACRMLDASQSWIMERMQQDTICKKPGRRISSAKLNQKKVLLISKNKKEIMMMME
jgi:hypothetical protein